MVRDSGHEVRVATVPEPGNRIRFDVSDNGSGMSEEVKAKLFASFFSTKGHLSTGLGLLVTRKHIEEHGGTISFTSHLGEGTRFTIRLPFTLAINQALLVKAGEDTFCIPLGGVESVVRVDRNELARCYASEEDYLEYGGNRYQLKHLGSLLRAGEPEAESDSARVPVLLVRIGETRVALQVEALIGNREIVVKPLDVMGGQSIFLVQQGDLNTNVIFEVMTANGQNFVQAQAYIPEIVDGGDKRILLIDGRPVEKVLARIPPPGDARGNMAVGGTTEGRDISDRDRWICDQVGPVLREKGIIFAGLDVIGDYMTEVNVTSPTGIRELDKLYGLNIAGELFDVLESRLAD